MLTEIETEAKLPDKGLLGQAGKRKRERPTENMTIMKYEE